jgi:hypothetical protein
MQDDHAVNPYSEEDQHPGNEHEMPVRSSFFVRHDAWTCSSGALSVPFVGSDMEIRGSTV